MILLTGATGFIGSHLLPALSKKFPVRCFVRASSAHKIKNGQNVEIFVGDFLKFSDAEKALQGIDVVVHCAALLRNQSPEEIQRVNVGATRQLILASEKQHVLRFIYLSSENALREDLHDAYATTKRDAEKIVQTFHSHLILRPCFVYGPGDTHGLGRLVEMVENSFVVPLFGGIRARMQPLFIDDLVEYILRSVKSPIIEGSFTLAGQDELTLNDFLIKVCAIRRKKRFFLTIPYPFLKVTAHIGQAMGPKFGWGPDQLQNLYYSRTYPMAQTIETFGYKPQSLDEGLKKWLGPPS